MIFIAFVIESEKKANQNRKTLIKGVEESVCFIQTIKYSGFF